MIILHLISYPQFTYDLFHMHHSPSYLSREHMNPKLTCSQRQWLHSSVGRASHRYREVTGSSPVEVLNLFRLLYAIAKIAIITAKIILHLILNHIYREFSCLPPEWPRDPNIFPTTPKRQQRWLTSWIRAITFNRTTGWKMHVVMIIAVTLCLTTHK